MQLRTSVETNGAPSELRKKFKRIAMTWAEQLEMPLAKRQNALNGKPLRNDYNHRVSVIAGTGKMIGS